MSAVSPRITPPAAPNPTVEQGDAIMLHCPVEGNPPPVKEWEFDGTPLLEDPRKYIFYDNGSLLLLNPQGEDSGRYTCRARNQLGEDVISVTLNVNGEC